MASLVKTVHVTPALAGVTLMAPSRRTRLTRYRISSLPPKRSREQGKDKRAAAEEDWLQVPAGQQVPGHPFQRGRMRMDGQTGGVHARPSDGAGPSPRAPGPARSLRRYREVAKKVLQERPR